MNIFEIFFSGNRRVNEENLSSALQFMLDPGASHGYGISAITEFLEPIGPQIISLFATSRSIASRKVSLRSVMASFKHFSIDLEDTVFNPVRGEMQKLRKIDLTIQCQDDLKIPRLIIAIENKIVSSSAQDKRQLAEEYNFLRQRLNKDFPLQNNDQKIIPIIFIYLTPEELSGETLNQWDELKLSDCPIETVADFKAHYTWKPRDNSINLKGSVTLIARSLLQKELDGTISPASSYASLFLRSMINFIDNDFIPESRGDPLQDTPDNAKEIISESQFWQAWHGSKAGSIALAKSLHERLVRSLMPDKIDFSLTRIGYFVKGKRQIALMFQPPTTNGRVTLQVKSGNEDNSAHRLALEFEQNQIAFKSSGINIEVQIQNETDTSSLDKLVKNLVEQIP